MRNRIKIYYKDEMVCTKHMSKSTSKSPTKPKLVVSKLLEVAPDHAEIVDFDPLVKTDFEIAHYPEYVNRVFNYNKEGEMLPSSIPWSQELVTSLTYTSASLYNAITNSISNANDLHFAPCSGFHHARPAGGSGFCTFSGQVIASVKVYRELGISGCYLDLDGHFGNSIEDTRSFCSDLNDAIPNGFNFNPDGQNEHYTKHLEYFLYGKLSNAILEGKIGYVVWCHGADSNMSDDLGGQVDTKHWVECSTIFWSWVEYMESKHNIKVPVSFALFGGYRRDAYDSVISLHVSDIVCGINTCISPDIKVDYVLQYKESKKKNWYY